MTPRPLRTVATPPDEPGPALGSEYMDARTYFGKAPRQPARAARVEAAEENYHGSNASLFMDEPPADAPDR